MKNIGWAWIFPIGMWLLAWFLAMVGITSLSQDGVIGGVITMFSSAVIAVWGVAIYFEQEGRE